MKKCSKCQTTKPRSEFHKNRCRYDGLANYCKGCAKEHRRAHYLKNRDAQLRKNKEWWDANREYWNAWKREWRKSPKQREKDRQSNLKWKAALAGAEGHHTIEQRLARFAYFGNRCVKCGTTERLSADHNIPLSRGGTNWAANIVPLCLNCNSAKHTKTLKEFLG